MTQAVTQRAETLTLDRAAFLDAIAIASTVLPSRTTKAILANVKLSAGPEGAEVLATDLEIGLRIRVLGVQAGAPTSLLLPTARLRSIIAAAKGDQVTIAKADDKLRVRVQGAKYELPSEDPDLYNDVPSFDAADYHTVAANDMRKLIRRTLPHMDLESTRYALGGALVEATDGTLTLVSTDGRRLAKQTSPAEVAGKGFGNAAVMPQKALRLVDRLLDDDGPVDVARQGDNAVVIRTGNATVYSRLVEGRFPRYQDVFPGQFDTLVKVPVGVLHAATVQAAIVTDEGSRGVDYTFAGDAVTLVAQAADVGSGDVEAPITTERGEPVTLTLDPRYLIDALKTLDPEAVATIELIDAKSAVVCRFDDGFTFVLMVLTRDR